METNIFSAFKDVRKQKNRLFCQFLKEFDSLSWCYEFSKMGTFLDIQSPRNVKQEVCPTMELLSKMSSLNMRGG